MKNLSLLVAFAAALSVPLDLSAHDRIGDFFAGWNFVCALWNLTTYFSVSEVSP